MSLLKYSLGMDQRFAARNTPFFWVLARRFDWGSIGTVCSAILPSIDRRPDSAHARKRDLRAFAKKAGYKVVGVGRKPPPGRRMSLRRTQEGPCIGASPQPIIDVILVTELTRWGRSMLDLFHTLQDLQAWGVSLVAQTGLQFDLRSAQGQLIASLMAALAEFERDLLRERVRVGDRGGS